VTVMRFRLHEDGRFRHEFAASIENINRAVGELRSHSKLTVIKKERRSECGSLAQASAVTAAGIDIFSLGFRY